MDNSKLAGVMPLYMQLAHQLQATLARSGAGAGVGTARRSLPSERQLSASLAVSRDTARRALALLSERGLLERRRGSGSYATGQTMSGALAGRRQWLRREAAPATAEEMLALGLPLNAAVARLQWLTAGGSEIGSAWAALESCSLALPLLPQPQRFSGDPLAHLQAQGLSPTRSLQQLHPINASPEQARLLGVAVGQALLQISCRSYSAEGQVLLISRSLRLGELSLELRR